VEKCRLAAKPVIVATHMLESMIVNPLPTRAEVTDIAHAAVTGTDSTMLSGETAKGKYPYQALSLMGRVLAETEKSHPPMFLVGEDIFSGRHEAFANAAVSMAISLEAKAIILFTRTKTTARAVSHLRPPVPVFAITNTSESQRALQLLYGVTPIHIPFTEDFSEMIATALQTVKQNEFLESGDLVVLITTMNEKEHTINTVQNRLIP
jgi:pyruvate kinase